MADWADQIAAILAQQRANDPNRTPPDYWNMMAAAPKQPVMTQGGQFNPEIMNRYLNGIQDANTLPQQQPDPNQQAANIGLSTQPGGTAYKNAQQKAQQNAVKQNLLQKQQQEAQRLLNGQ
jgi:hypothetical protein